MIDWERKTRSLAIMIETRRPIKEIRAMAKGIMELMELEQQERDLFWAWHRCKGTREEAEEAYFQYILAIRRVNYASEILDKLSDDRR